MTKMEVLAPAGSFDTFKKVIAAGADAVYMGGDLFGARAYASNFNNEEVLRALDYAHVRDRKIYLTVNTLLKNQEIEEKLYEYLKSFDAAGLDAVIVQDMGVLSCVRKWFPQMAVHASTQMSVADAQGAAYLKSLGLTRVVPARELSMEEVAAIHQSVDIELECFVHGALCYCYSGQCLFSSILGGRSGNRGRCAQPCRLAYDVKNAQGQVLNPSDKYVLSMKDLCTIDLIPQMAKAGIDSLKIEGRMKQAEYAAGVTSMYRKYVDAYYENPGKPYTVSKEDRQFLLDLGNRSGFTDGYYPRHNGKEMLSCSNPSHSGKKDLQQDLLAEAKCAISGCLTALEGQPLQLSVYTSDVDVFVEGDVVQAAQNRPMSSEDLAKRVKKTGETPFIFGQLDVFCDDHIFVPIQSLNQLRRDALMQLEEKMLQPYRRGTKEGTESLSILPNGVSNVENLAVGVQTKQQFQAVVSCNFVKRVILNAEMFQTCATPKAYMDALNDQIKQCQAQQKESYLRLPVIFRKETEQFYKQLHALGAFQNLNGLAVSSMDGAAWAAQIIKETDGTILFEPGCYTWSEPAREAYAKMGDVTWFTAPYELNKKEFEHRYNGNSDFCVYGFVPMMVSAQCVYRTVSGCKKYANLDQPLYLQDRYFKNFLITRNCKDCYNVIYNSQPQMLFHQSKVLQQLGFGGFRMSFAGESAKEVQKCLKFYEKAFLQKESVSSEQYGEDFTNGHFKRGVE